MIASALAVFDISNCLMQNLDEHFSGNQLTLVEYITRDTLSANYSSMAIIPVNVIQDDRSKLKEL